MASVLAIKVFGFIKDRKCSIKTAQNRMWEEIVRKFSMVGKGNLIQNKEKKTEI